LSFQQFNPVLGILTNVQLDLSGSVNATLSVNNGSQNASLVKANIDTQIIVQDAGNNLASPAIDLTVPTISHTVNGGDTWSSGILTKSDSSSNQYTAAGVLSEFTGIGSISLNAASLTETMLSYTGGNLDIDQLTYAQLNGSVTYTYNQNIPEPATIIFMSLGIVTFFRKKKFAVN
jgi:hypothetical protein